MLLRTWPRLNRKCIWLATTDADSRVPRHWLQAQVAAHEAGVAMWTGKVDVLDWSHRTRGMAKRWAEAYDAEAIPIHGASMGINAQAYVDLGGFLSLATGEDRDLYERAVVEGIVMEHDSVVKVVTSTRRDARAPLGFAHALTTFERSLLEEVAIN